MKRNKTKWNHKTDGKKLVALIILIAIVFIVFKNLTIEKPFVLKYFEYEDIKTPYIESIDESKENTIFFLHGAGVRSITYIDSLKLLAKDYNIIAADIPVPEGLWDLEDYAEYFNHFLEEKDLQDVILMGHSFGGGIVINMAKDTKKAIYIILIDAVGVEVSKYSSKKDFEKNLDKLAGRLKRNTFVTFVATRDYLYNVLTNLSSLDHVNDIVQNSLHRNYNYDDISTSTTILWGGNENEDLFDEKVAELLHQAIPNSELIFVGGGHDWPLFNKEKFVSFVQDILIKNLGEK